MYVDMDVQEYPFDKEWRAALLQERVATTEGFIFEGLGNMQRRLSGMLIEFLNSAAPLAATIFVPDELSVAQRHCALYMYTQ